MNAIKSSLQQKIQVGCLWAALVCPLPSDFWEQEVYKTSSPSQINPEGLDPHRREKLAELLLPTEPRKVYIQLPETKAAQDLTLDQVSPEDNLQRARVLTQYNRNALVLKTLEA